MRNRNISRKFAVGPEKITCMMLVCGCVTIDSENTCTAPNMFFGARNELSQFENVKTSFGVSSVGSLEAPMCLGLGFFLERRGVCDPLSELQPHHFFSKSDSGLR